MHSNDVTKMLFRQDLSVVRGVYIGTDYSDRDNQSQTNNAFTEKWVRFRNNRDSESWKLIQFQWYLQLYGFANERELEMFMGDKTVVLDAGCGLGYKAAWFAQMNRDAVVVAMDFSDSIFLAAERYHNEPNLVFVKGNIASTPFKDGVFDWVNCDQVLHHTECPPQTLEEFGRISTKDGVLSTYVYNEKALPRELLDDHFREYCKVLTYEEIWALSEQLTQLGKTLSDLRITIDVPEMPALQIQAGKYDLQRFIYWNFIKCFWNEDFGWEISVNANFDWYSPSNAFRYTREEFVGMLKTAGFQPEYLHSEEACHTGRFHK